MKLAVIGKDVSKSLSPEIHTFIAERTGNAVTYDKISLTAQDFNEKIPLILREYDGFNVTIPYKVEIIRHLSAIVGDAEAYGSVNTVRCFDRTGHNTDGMGFGLMLKNSGVEVAGKKVLLLGAGGAGRSVAKKLSDNGAKVSLYDRRAENSAYVAAAFTGVNAIEKIELTPYYAIINATGVGMHDSVGVSPVGPELIALCDVAVDLIYAPAQSEFLRLAEIQKKRTVNGLAMLFYQAYFSQCIYFCCQPDYAQAKRLFEEFSEKFVEVINQ